VERKLIAGKIYSGPSGKFQAHVDTPRGTMQFGSLVVCFPHPHEGSSTSNPLIDGKNN
jgi:alpha/beta superfamily hydrolase